MEIKPPNRVTPVESYKDKSFEQEESGLLSKKLKAILSNLRSSVLDLADWVKETAFCEKDKINENNLLDFVKKIEAFYASINDLEEYTDKPESQKDLHFALEILAEIDDMLKGDIKKLTLCSYWKFDDFSFQMAMEKTIITPLIDVKRAIIHLFDEISDQNWQLVISAFEKMAEKLLH